MGTNKEASQPWHCQAKDEYNRIRDFSAFTVKGAVKVLRNGHSSSYLFPDGSKLVILYYGARRYHGNDGKAYSACVAITSYDATARVVRFAVS